MIWIQNFEIFHFLRVPGPDCFQKNMILLKNVQKIGTLGGPKVEKTMKCLTKWVRLAPIELKLCRNDQALIRTSILLILANCSYFFT